VGSPQVVPITPKQLVLGAGDDGTTTENHCSAPTADAPDLQKQISLGNEKKEVWESTEKVEVQKMVKKKW
jgi:hypothetical protein